MPLACLVIKWRNQNMPRQLAMRFATHGGKRPGAGRKARGPRASEKHRVRPRHDAKHPLHVVIRVVGGIRLRRRAGWRAVRHALGVTLRRHDFRICHVSIQATHVHFLVEADDRMSLARGMQGFQIACARRFNRLRRRRGRLFSDRYHPVALRSPRQVRHAISYVMNNWRKHREDTGSNLRLDPYSSAVAFVSWNPRPQSETDPERERLMVVLPSTWLLAHGWRRYGPISPRERPGPVE